MTESEEIQNLRQRCHDLGDTLQIVVTEQALLKLTMSQLRSDLDHVKAVSATSTQLQNAVEIFTLKLDGFSENLKAHNRIVSWTVALVMAMILGAVVQLVLK